MTQLFLLVWPSFLTQRHFPLQWVLWIFFFFLSSSLSSLVLLRERFFFFSFLLLFKIFAEQQERRALVMIRKKECFPHFELFRFHSKHKILPSSFLWVGQSISILYRKGLRDIQAIFVPRREECLLELLLPPDTSFLSFETPIKCCSLHRASSASPCSR